MPPPLQRKLKPDFKPELVRLRKPDEKPAPQRGLAVPVLYLLLASLAVWVQGNKWAAFHYTKNLVALAVSVLALVVAATYLLRAFQARRDAGL